MDGIILRGKWEKGILVRGEIRFDKIESIERVVLEENEIFLVLDGENKKID